MLLSLDSCQADIIEVGLDLFQFVYGDADVILSKHRSLRYHKMIARATLRPESLPPTEGAATQHVYPAYLQYHDWLLLIYWGP